MRHANKLAFVCFLLAVVAAPGRARAQPAAQATTDTAGARADDLAHKGNDLALKDKWAEAEALFTQAWALKQSYDIGGNLGIAELELGKHRDAAEHLSFALTHFPANGKADHRDLLREKLALARKQVGARSIEVSVAGAEVLIDGASIGTAPLTAEVFLTPGTRTVEARLAGYDAAKRTVDVAAGSTDRIALALRQSGPADSVPTSPPWRPGPALLVPAGVLAAAGLAVGAGLTVVANGKASAADMLRAKAGSNVGCSGAAASNSDCTTLLSDLKNRDTFTKAAFASFVVGGALAAATAGLGVWTATTPKDRKGASGVRVVPILGRDNGGIAVLGNF